MKIKSVVFPALLVVLLSTSLAFAVHVKFQWNASTGSVAGYRLHQGTTSGNYDPTKETTFRGTETTGGMEMDPTASRYVAATAYDAADRRSAFSNEILCHPVTVSFSAGGSVSPSGSFFVQDGNNVVFTITPASGSWLTKLSVNGIPQTITVSSSQSTFTLSGVNALKNISATFEQLQIPGPPSQLKAE